ncbi:MAG TPA: cytochrome c [Thermoanaerobaculia bacterium]|nr:cytochrome c [Thermoanaerobaculia bacterium]
MRRSDFALAAVLLALSGCARGCTSSRPPVHINPNMFVEPRYEPQAASAFFYNGAEMRPPVPGTVARGELRDMQSLGPYWTGKDAGGAFVTAIPMAVDAAVRERGAERFDIYCAACHDKGGDGKGILFERGKVPTPSFHDDRLRTMPDGQIFDTVTNGFGLMPSYRYPIPVADRWAIIVHLRELQAHRLERSGGTMPAQVQPAAPASAPAQTAAPEQASAQPAAPGQSAPQPANPPQVKP